MSAVTAIRILLADDQEIYRCALGLLVEKSIPQAVLVGTATNGREAIQLARQFSPDLVLLDVAMPVLNGIDALCQIMHDNPRVRVIMLSMHGDPHYVDSALRAGAKGYILKGSSVSELVAAINTVLDGKTYLCPTIADWVVSRHVRGADDDGDADHVLAASLSIREREVLQLLAEGHTSKDIAANLFIGIKTVESHRSQIMSKLNIRSIAELTKYAVRCGITSL